ncbi:MAG: hypothetical protein R3F11_14795 [Verrucomicrobiales bacterium]
MIRSTSPTGFYIPPSATRRRSPSNCWSNERSQTEPIYTIAFDAPGYALAQRAMAKLLASSLLRTFFDGEILIFRNSPAPIFAIERERVDEIYIEMDSVGVRRAAASGHLNLKQRGTSTHPGMGR